MKELHIIDELKRLSRRIEEIRKVLDLLFKDREILEDLLTRMSAVENALKLQRATTTESTKDLRADVAEMKDMVETKVDQVSETMDNKTVIVKTAQPNMIQKIVDRLKGGEL